MDPDAAVIPWTVEGQPLEDWTATAADPGDVGHAIPDDVWAAVTAAVEAASGVEPAPPGLFGVPDRTITARSHGGVMAGAPRLGVIHSAETPLQAGYAYSIAANWFATKATTSATVMVDPGETIRLLPDNVVAYHVGPKGNGFSVGVEQAGYATLSRADWLSPAGRAQLARVAAYMRECWDRWGIPLRWATDAQILAAAAGGPAAGWCTHEDVRRVLGGTTHTDPGANYPRAELMAYATGTDDGGDEDMNGAQQALLETVHNQLVVVQRSLGSVPADVWSHGLAYPADAPAVPAGRWLTDTRVIARRSEVATLALAGDVAALGTDLRAALEAEGVQISGDQLDGALRRVLGSLDDKDDQAPAVAG